MIGDPGERWLAAGETVRTEGGTAVVEKSPWRIGHMTHFGAAWDIKTGVRMRYCAACGRPVVIEQKIFREATWIPVVCRPDCHERVRRIQEREESEYQRQLKEETEKAEQENLEYRRQIEEETAKAEQERLKK